MRSEVIFGFEHGLTDGVVGWSLVVVVVLRSGVPPDLMLEASLQEPHWEKGR